MRQECNRRSGLQRLIPIRTEKKKGFYNNYSANITLHRMFHPERKTYVDNICLHPVLSHYNFGAGKLGTIGIFAVVAVLE